MSGGEVVREDLGEEEIYTDFIRFRLYAPGHRSGHGEDGWLTCRECDGLLVSSDGTEPWLPYIEDALQRWATTP